MDDVAALKRRAYQDFGGGPGGYPRSTELPPIRDFTGDHRRIVATSRLRRGEACGTQVLACPASKVGGKLQKCPLCIAEGGVVCLLAVYSRDTVGRLGGIQTIVQLCCSFFELLFLHFCFTNVIVTHEGARPFLSW